MFPITLPAGTHKLIISGESHTGVINRNIGIEIYDISIVQMQSLMSSALTSIQDLEQYVIFTTKGLLGVVQTSDTTLTCSESAKFNNCDGVVKCDVLLEHDCLDCLFYYFENCENPRDVFTIKNPIDNESLEYELGKAYKFIHAPENCYFLKEIFYDRCEIPDFEEAELISSFNDCNSCKEGKGCYEFVNCETNESFIFNDNFGQYNGNVVEANIIDPNTGYTYSGCFIVNLISCSGEILYYWIVDILNCFKFCEECNPPIPPVPAFEVEDRPILPKWNIDCPPDYVERVNCKFAEAVYQEAMNKRYGIEFCCDKEQEKWEIKKELLNLKALEKPNVCISLPCKSVDNLIAKIQV
jgi:hypothetical protein